MKRTGINVMALLAGLAGAAPARAQYAPRPIALAHGASVDTSRAQRQAPVIRPPNDAGMLGGGLLLGATGFFAGGFAGAHAACSGFAQGNEFCGLIGFVYGGTVGESLLLPLGVHLANGRRGNYAASALASAGIGLVGLALGLSSGSVVPLVLTPVAQLGVSIAIERSTSRERQDVAR